MKIIREIEQGEMLPSIWWGLFYYRYDRNRIVIAPLGLNLVFAFVRGAWLWVACDMPNKINKAVEQRKMRRSA